MRKIAMMLTFLMQSFPMAALASDTTPGPVKEPTAASNTKSVLKKAWMEGIQTNLPEILCQKDHYFLKCFSIEDKECVDLNKLFVQACLNNVAVSLPAELTPQDAEHWGAVIGKCSLDVFEKFLSSKKLKKPECADKSDKLDTDKTEKKDKAKPKK